MPFLVTVKLCTQQKYWCYSVEAAVKDNSTKTDIESKE